MTRFTLLIIFLILTSFSVNAQKAKHTFKLGTSEFLLDKKPFQIISGELHPARIPFEYWRHRIWMAKAMGCNTISAYIFWNYHETEEGVYDFTSGNRNLSEFFKICQEEEMWLILRPGPYVCAEWELGGIPPYLLRIPDIKLRSMDPRYMTAAERYMAKLSEVIKPFLITNGGPILMLQIENEYGSFGNEKEYMLRLKNVWTSLGINIPTFTGDGPSTAMLSAGTLPGSAIGLDPCSSEEDFALAASINPGVPVFSSETYPGWLTHWGEKWAKPDTTELFKEVRFLMDNKKSFNFYVLHGGTNFGFTAGANSGGKGYEPHVTSYDYDAPVNEQGLPTPKYMALRKLIGSYLPKGKVLFPIPDPAVPSVDLGTIEITPFTSIWNYLPEPVISERPGTFESYGQDHGFIVYKTELKGEKSGKLIAEIHDYATIFLNGKYIGFLDRREGINSIDIPGDGETATLEILVEAMGRINYGKNLTDRKGITDKVTINGTEILNWQIYKLPMNKRNIWDLRSSAKNMNKPGLVFRGNFYLTVVEGNFGADTYFDLSNYTKGIVWVNGHCLGRYWNIGPQKRLYCPAVWLLEGVNEILIFDSHQLKAMPVSGMKTQE